MINTSIIKTWISRFKAPFTKGTKKPACPKLEAYIESIDTYNASQSNSEMLEAIRQYNHSIIDSLDSIRPLNGTRLLDVGASPHGYALERALAIGVKEYVGIGLDIDDDFFIETSEGSGSLSNMNAESLLFHNNEFDMIVSISTFEHIGDLNSTLSEFYRVLSPKGLTLITFEPIWTCSYGHHLHHLGEVSKIIPDWAHLLWTKNEMKEYLDNYWPENESLSASEACSWIYEGDAINRKGINEIRKALFECPFHIEWISPMIDTPRDQNNLDAAIKKTGLNQDDLMTKGLSILLCKKE